MTVRELIEALREDAEWAEANEWETPITLCDNLTEAADRLEVLLAENERLKAGNVPTKWVSVEEWMPEENIDVLTLVDGKYKNISFERAPMICAWFGNEGWFCNEYPEWDNPGVTHWMPLPSTEGVE